MKPVFVGMALVAFATSLTAQGDDSIPEAKRAEIVESVRSGIVAAENETHTRKVEDIEKKITSARKGTIDKKAKVMVAPKVPGKDPYKFTSQSEKEATITKLETERNDLKDLTGKALKDPSRFTTELGVFEAGKYGSLRFRDGTVVKVVNDDSAIITVSQFVGGSKPDVRKVDLFFSNLDGKNLAEDAKVQLGDVYYISGNTKVGGRTLMKAVRVVFTEEEKKRIASVAK